MTDLDSRYDVDNETVRFEYPTEKGIPPEWIKLDGENWKRQGFHPLSYDPSRGLVWFKKFKKS